MSRQPLEVFGRQGSKAWSEATSIVVLDLEDHLCTGRTQNRQPHVLGELPKVLVCEHQPDAESPRLRQHVRKSQRQAQKILKLVQIEHDRMTALGFGRNSR